MSKIKRGRYALSFGYYLVFEIFSVSTVPLVFMLLSEGAKDIYGDENSVCQV